MADKIELSEKLSKVFTNERIKIIRAIQHKQPKTIGELAKFLGRDISAVYRDLRLLENHNIVELTKTGKAVQPCLTRDELVISISNIIEHEEEEDEDQSYIG